MTVYQGTQAPHMMQNLFAKHLDLAGAPGARGHQGCRRLVRHQGAHLCRRDGDRRAVETAASGRSNSSPTGIESFVTDIHARDHRVKGKIGVNKDGTITAFEIDDLTGIGPYSVYPRTSGIEANQVVNLTGGPYTCPNYRAQARVVFQNKNVMCQYRAVGHPIAVAVTEGLVDLAAAKIGMDPLEIRRRNLIPDDALSRADRRPASSSSSCRTTRRSAHLDTMMNYEAPARRAGGAARERHLSRHRLCAASSR